MPQTSASFLDIFKTYMTRVYGEKSIEVGPNAKGKYPHFTFYLKNGVIHIE